MFFVFQAFDGIVVLVFEPYGPVFWDSLFVDCEAVILTCDVASACFNVRAWLVLRSVSILELVGLCARCNSHDLASKADSTRWDLSLETFAHSVMRFFWQHWVAGSV